MCRGFAFVDFLSKQEARSAADAVAGTHLYGRRLVSLSSSHPTSYRTEGACSCPATPSYYRSWTLQSCMTAATSRLSPVAVPCLTGVGLHARLPGKVAGSQDAAMLLT